MSGVRRFARFVLVQHVELIALSGAGAIELRLSLQRLHSRRLLREVGAHRVASVGFSAAAAPAFASAADAARAVREARAAALRDGLRLPGATPAATWRWLCARHGEPRSYFLCEADGAAAAAGGTYSGDRARASAVGSAGRAERHLRSADDVREWHVPSVGANVAMGVHKYAARMDLMLSKTVPALECVVESFRHAYQLAPGRGSQSLSATEGAAYAAEAGERQLPIATVREIGDVVSSAGNVMTDGCAPAGSAVIAAAVAALRPGGSLEGSGRPCAVQGRLGGYKGVWFLDPGLPPNVICVRPSMRKVELPPESATATQTHFEALRAVGGGSGGGGMPGTLNRQFVLLLEGWGVPQETLLRLLGEALKPIVEMTSSPTAAAAVLRRSASDLATESVANRNGSTTEDGPSAFWMEKEALDLLDAGLWGEPRLAQVLGRLRASRMQSLARRTRLPVTNSRTAVLLADPTGLLRPGEVFFRSCSGGNQQLPSVPVEGAVVLLRNPCYDPRHLVLANAVSSLSARAGSPASAARARQLELALEGVVLMPVTGAEPLAQQLSGGDYDGDVAWICWDKRLVDPVAARMAEHKRAAAAGDAPAAPPPLGAQPHQQPPVTVDVWSESASQSIHGGGSGAWPPPVVAQQRLWLSSLASAELGHASNLHSALIDQLLSRAAELGLSTDKVLWDARALHLAQLCDANVDSAKTGITWPVPHHLAANITYPEYMARPSPSSAHVPYASSSLAVSEAFRAVSRSGWGRVFAASQAIAAAVEANDNDGARCLVCALLEGGWALFLAALQAREARQQAQTDAVNLARNDSALLASPSADVVAAVGWEATLTPRMPLATLRPSPILVERARQAKWWQWRAIAEVHMSAYGRDVVEGSEGSPSRVRFDSIISDVEIDSDCDDAELDLDSVKPRSGRDWSRLRARHRLLFDDSAGLPGVPRSPEDRASLALAYYMTSWSRFYDEERSTGRGKLRAFPWVAGLPELVAQARAKD